MNVLAQNPNLTVPYNKESEISSCIDSDGGINLYEKGTITFKEWVTSIDECTIKGNVREYWCEVGEPKFETFSCKDWEICLNKGYCEKFTIKYDCKETDNGYDIYNKGSVKSEALKSEFFDMCENKNNLKEVSCAVDGKPNFKTVNCEDGCENGVCIEKEEFEEEEEKITECEEKGGSIIYWNKECKQGYYNAGAVFGATRSQHCCLPLEEEEEKCVDSDNGQDYYIKGTVTLGDNVYVDNCETSESVTYNLLEYYCSEKGINSKQFTCPNGCKNGACVKEEHDEEEDEETVEEEQDKEWCWDSDGGIKPYTTGIVRFSLSQMSWASTSTDYCNNDTNRIQEFWCDNGIIKNTLIECPNGCRSNFACLENGESDWEHGNEKWCWDSDNSQEPYSWGFVNFYLPDINWESISMDVCKEGKVKEYWCENNEQKHTLIECLNGCKDGVCISGGGEEITKPEVCNTLDDDNDGEVDEDFDSDGDGYFDSQDCNDIYEELDCNDSDSTIHPNTAEICDRKDNDCNGEIDTINGRSLQRVFQELDRDYYQVCQDGQWIEADCSQTEDCSNNIDSDCDDLILDEDPDCVEINTNMKDMNKYSEKQTFLISDMDWHNVLPLVPVTTWTGNEEDCQRGYGSPDNVCVYPTLIYHEENTGFDADSIIYFMQQYFSDNLIIVGQTPEELENLLISQPDLGAGLNENQLNRINANDYFSYWQSYNNIVYVEDDYELALLASTYASLINAPLVIQGTDLDTDNVFDNKNVICVGNIDRECDEQYNLEQLQQKYVDETNTDKIILINPDDWDIKVVEEFQPERSTGNVYNLYTKTSLVAPILASAKHEVILSTTLANYLEIDSFIELKINNLDSNFNYLTIISEGNTIPISVPNRELEHLVSRGEDHQIELDNFYYADINTNNKQELAVGRIMGLSLSDISSQLTRTLFYNQLHKSDNFAMLFKHAEFYHMKLDAKLNDKLLIASGFNKQSIYTDDDKTMLEPTRDLSNKFYISYLDHGSKTGWGGINTYDMRTNNIWLNPSIINSAACSTCSYKNTGPGRFTSSQNLFCTNVIRRGAIAHIGAVEIVFSTYSNLFLEQLFDNDLGTALKKSKNMIIIAAEKMEEQKVYSKPEMLLGDPTFNLYLDYPPIESITRDLVGNMLIINFPSSDIKFDYARYFYVDGRTNMLNYTMFEAYNGKNLKGSSIFLRTQFSPPVAGKHNGYWDSHTLFNFDLVFENLNLTNPERVQKIIDGDLINYVYQDNSLSEGYHGWRNYIFVNEEDQSDKLNVGTNGQDITISGIKRMSYDQITEEEDIPVLDERIPEYQYKIYFSEVDES